VAFAIGAVGARLSSFFPKNNRSGQGRLPPDGTTDAFCTAVGAEDRPTSTRVSPLATDKGAPLSAAAPTAAATSGCSSTERASGSKRAGPQQWGPATRFQRNGDLQQQSCRSVDPPSTLSLSLTCPTCIPNMSSQCPRPPNPWGRRFPITAS
jgi:hypothetical protein